MCYIKGGIPPGGAKPNKGCFRDKNDPIEFRQTSFNYELYFAGRSGTWGNGGVLVLRRRLSVFVWHIVPFFFEERDCSLTLKGGGAARDEGTVGGIPFKEDPNVARPC
jgi:hypothetical protein